jgi:hypothetical protein
MSRKKTTTKTNDKQKPPLPEKGNVEATAVGAIPACRKQCIYKMMADKSQLEDIITVAREMIVREAENSLLKNIQKGNVTSIIFALKTLGRSKGYVINGYKPDELAAKINRAVLKRLTDEQLDELEKLLKKKKDLATFIKEIGLDAPSG